MKKVSVVIPVYNVEAYLQESLNDIMQQSLQEIEIICVNDGSTDSSLSILEENSKCDERIIIINKMNGGLSSARNAGARVAKGEYIYFFDSDDRLHLHALSQLYERSRRDNLDICYFDASVFFDEAAMEDKYRHKLYYYKRLHHYGGVYTGESLFSQFVMNKEYLASVCLQFTRREFYEDKGLSFYEGIIFEDNLYTLQSLLQAERVSHLGEALFRRRYRKGSLMTSPKSVKKLYSLCVLITQILVFLLEHSFSLSSQRAAESILRGLAWDALQSYIALRRSNESAESETKIKSLWGDVEFMVKREMNRMRRAFAKSP